jgi:hypothetical protein
VRVTGRLQRDAAAPAWVFVVDDEDDGSPGHEFVVMPGSLLEEMERMINAADDRRLVFEITGQAYVYRQRNYLLLTHPPLLIGHESPPEDAVSSEDDDDSTDRIIEDLERSIGPVRRRQAAAAQRANEGPLLAEGTVVTARRGRIRRTERGGFVFVFDADAEGLADPPMRLLPCLLLERLEEELRKTGERLVVLLSGHVYTYRGRNYLRPTLYRTPRERTLLTP